MIIFSTNFGRVAPEAVQKSANIILTNNAATSALTLQAHYETEITLANAAQTPIETTKIQ